MRPVFSSFFGLYCLQKIFPLRFSLEEKSVYFLYIFLLLFGGLCSFLFYVYGISIGSVVSGTLTTGILDLVVIACSLD